MKSWQWLAREFLRVGLLLYFECRDLEERAVGDPRVDDWRVAYRSMLVNLQDLHEAIRTGLSGLDEIPVEGG